MFYQRKIIPLLEREINTKQAVVITGMRQVGKTSILNYLFDKIDSVNKVILDMGNPLHQKIFEEENYDNIWNNLLAYKITNQKKAYIFLDEIQNLPQISKVVKYLYDHWQVKFFLTGSSSYYLKNLFPESLAGRKLVFEVFPLVFEEFLWFKNLDKIFFQDFHKKASKKNLISYERYHKQYLEYMEYGGFPAVVLEQDRERKKKMIEEIFKSYFEKDVKYLSDFKEIGKLRDLILLLAPRTGSKIDVAKIASELSLSRETIYSYLLFLEQTYFISLLPRYSRSIDRSVAGGKKVYFCDSGIINVLGKISLGQNFENSVFQNLRPYHQLSFYNKNGAEIDFIINKEIAAESKLNFSQGEISQLLRLAGNLDFKKVFGVSLRYLNNKNIISAIDI